MKKVMTFAVLTIVVLLGARIPASAWTPPIGIPAPPFGINETAGPFTHYVDNTSPAATDANNPNGSPSKPRQTIPPVLSAGSVVEVHGGPYIYDSAGNVLHTFNGTAQQPVFLRGVGAPAIQGPGTFAQGVSDRDWRVTGSYYIVEGFKFINGTTMAVVVLGDHIGIRNNEFANYNRGGSGASLGGAATTYCVIYDNHIHHGGNYLSSHDDKTQGIQFTVPASGAYHHIWVLNNEIDHNGGQSIQIGDDYIPDYTQWPHHIYVGFNFMHEDMEMAVALKQAHDVIISQNTIGPYYPYANGTICGTSSLTCHTATPSSIALGHFGSNNVWALFNRIDTGMIAIRANGNSPDDPNLPQNTSVYAIGNVITNMRSDTSSGGVPYDVTNAISSGAAFVAWSAPHVYAVDNTIINSLRGFGATGTGYFEVTGNLFVNISGQQVWLPTNWGTNKSDYNFYDSAARLSYGPSATILTLSQQRANAQDVHSSQGSSLLDGSFKPTTGSPVIDVSIRSVVYDTFFSLYGVDIGMDFVGTSRPQGAAWDIGANELSSGAGSPPRAPSGLIVR